MGPEKTVRRGFVFRMDVKRFAQLSGAGSVTVWDGTAGSYGMEPLDGWMEEDI